MRNKVINLEASLKCAELELERSKSRPVVEFSRREEFLLGEIDLISRQLQDVNPDWQAEQAQVEERVAWEATGDSYEARHFWSNRSRGRILACMLDRTWRADFLLKGCRKTLWHIHRVYFPHNGQPHELATLLERLRDGDALKEVVDAQLVAGANVALAYV